MTDTGRTDGGSPAIRVRVGCVMLLLVGLVLAGCATNPVTGEQEFSLISRKEGIRSGRQQHTMMTQLYDGELRDEALQTYVSRIGHQLAAVSHDPDLPYEFNVVNTSVPNAYALPGGFVTITRGLLLEMDHERELAAVIGHEIAHATARHGAQQYTRSVFTGLFLTVGEIYLRTEGVQSAGLYGDLGSIGAQAFLASYSRSQERQADRLGIHYMAKAGYDPEGMVDLQQTLLALREQQPGWIEQLFSTHPLSEERIADSRRVIGEVRREVDMPRDQRLNQFEPRVVETWKPRKPAYHHMDSGVAHLKNDKPEAAKEDFRTAIQTYDGEALFHGWLGRALSAQDKPEEARPHLDRALALNDGVFRLQLYSGVNHLELEQNQASLENLRRADELLSGFPDVMFFRGVNHDELGNREEAAKFYRRYLDKVSRGGKAEHARRRLREWGYAA